MFKAVACVYDDQVALTKAKCVSRKRHDGYEMRVYAAVRPFTVEVFDIEVGKCKLHKEYKGVM